MTQSIGDIGAVVDTEIGGGDDSTWLVVAAEHYNPGLKMMEEIATGTKLDDVSPWGLMVAVAQQRDIGRRRYEDLSLMALYPWEFSSRELPGVVMEVKEREGITYFELTTSSGAVLGFERTPIHGRVTLPYVTSGPVPEGVIDSCTWNEWFRLDEMLGRAKTQPEVTRIMRTVTDFFYRRMEEWILKSYAEIKTAKYRGIPKVNFNELVSKN